MRREEEYGQAFTHKRLKIIELLQTDPSTINELATKLSLRPNSIRHHIQVLEKVGAVEGACEASAGLGRPAKIYRVTQKPISIEYPRRQYEYLSDLLLEAFILSLGGKRVAQMLGAMGHEIGKRVVMDLVKRYNVEKWDLKLFREHVVDGYLNQMGSQPEIVEANEGVIRLRLHNCVFLEVARKYSDVMCATHEKIWSGIMESTDLEMSVERTKCMSHGDPYCEYLMRKKLLKPNLTRHASELKLTS